MSPVEQQHEATSARGVVATSIGNALEWFDFAIYAQFASYIALSFFPGHDANAQLLKAFLFFGVGFLVRPLGAVIIGQYADRAGRRAALTLTIALMAVGTGVIAASPGYATIGIAAPTLLLLARMLQGFSAGGEVGGAAAFLLESAPLHRRGRIGAWLQASMGVSNILGALVALLVTSLLTAPQVRAWGWRIPFVVGLAIVPVGLYMRRSVRETAAFREEVAPRRSAGWEGAPLVDIARHHGRDLLVGFCVSILWAVAVYVLLVFVPTYVQRPDTFGFTASQAFGASFIGNFPFVIGTLLSGALSDRIGRRLMIAIGATSLLLLVWPLFLWLRAVPTLTTLIAVQSCLCLLVASFTGAAPSAVAEIFPTAVRSTGTAIVYNGAFTVFGGFAPAILTWLTQQPGGSLFAPAWYVMAASVIALVALPWLGRPQRR